jgi:uncharacterized membrane protein
MAVYPFVTPADERDARKWALIVYILQACSLLVGITLLVAVILNYVKRKDMRGTLAESHFRWQINTFWYSLLWAVLGALTSIIGVGIVVLVAAGVWFLYRVIKGMVYLQDGKTMYLNNSPFPPGYKRGS